MKVRACSHLLSLAILAILGSGIGCAPRHSYRVYDPYYTDYHNWDRDEVHYYREWARETHHDEHRDLRQLRPEDQKDYWTWRHNHEDRDAHQRSRDH